MKFEFASLHYKVLHFTNAYVSSMRMFDFFAHVLFLLLCWLHLFGCFITGSYNLSIKVISYRIFLLITMVLDSECGETSCEEIDRGTTAKIAKEDVKDANDKQTAGIQVYPGEGCKQVYIILSLLIADIHCYTC
jgi:hypothetical protein